MKICYVPKPFRAETLKLIELADSISGRYHEVVQFLKGED